MSGIVPGAPQGRKKMRASQSFVDSIAKAIAASPRAPSAQIGLSIDAGATAGISAGLADCAAAIGGMREKQDAMHARLVAAIEAIPTALAKIQVVVNVSPTPMQIVVSPTPITFAPQVVAQAGKVLLENRLTVDANVLMPMRQERKAVVKDVGGRVIETITIGGAQ